jgi:hypothetical protein
MAIANKKASSTSPRKPAAQKKAVVTKITVAAPTGKTQGRVAKRFRYTGKKASETKPQTPQFVALVHSMQDIEDKSFDKESCTLQQVVDLGVEEGHISMPYTKNPEKQKKRIVACYKGRLLEERYIEEV